MNGCESWTIKKAEHWRTDIFELWCWRRLLRVPWAARRSVNLKGNQHWIFIGRTDAKAEAPILWLPDAKSRLIVKDPDAGKDWRQEKKQATEDEMVGWHHWLNGHEFEQTPGDSEGQGSLKSMGLQRVRHDWATELTEEQFGCFQIWQLWIKHKTFVCGFCCGHKLSTLLGKY